MCWTVLCSLLHIELLTILYCITSSCNTMRCIVMHCDLTLCVLPRIVMTWECVLCHWCGCWMGNFLYKQAWTPVRTGGRKEENKRRMRIEGRREMEERSTTSQRIELSWSNKPSPLTLQLKYLPERQRQTPSSSRWYLALFLFLHPRYTVPLVWGAFCSDTYKPSPLPLGLLRQAARMPELYICPLC